MKPIHCLLLVVGLFVLLVIGVSQYRPGWTADQQVGFWKSLETLQQMETDLRTQSELESQDQEILRRIAVKGRLTKDLIEERRTLREVARVLEEEKVVSQWTLGRLRALYPGSSDEEILCRHMIQYVGGAYLTQPSRAQILVARLEAELEADLKRGAIASAR